MLLTDIKIRIYTAIIIKIGIYRTIILHVLYRCETWSITLREERRLEVFKNGVLTNIPGDETEEVMVDGENFKMRSFMICTFAR
jgi:hypothetical protein